MNAPQGSSPRALRFALRRASREQRRAGAALRHSERCADALTTVLLNTRLAIAARRYRALLRLVAV